MRGAGSRRCLPLPAPGGRGSPGGVVVQAGRKRGGGCEVGSRGCTGAGDNWSLRTGLGGGERGHREDYLGREWG